MSDHESSIAVSEHRVSICRWPTDALAIDHRCDKSDYDGAPFNPRRRTEHTLLLFVPGNPGIIHWYTDWLVQIIRRLGSGYAVRGVSYAGHGVGEEVVGSDDDHAQSFHADDLGKQSHRANDMSIAWTMDGQIEHKICWIDKVLDEWGKERAPNLVFISHSIGAHFVQHLLLRRPDILARTRHVIHLMPFFRFDPPRMKRFFLSSTASFYKSTIPLMTKLVRAISATVPSGWIDLYLDKALGINCTKGRKIALEIFLHPNMVRNHLVLGFQEIRELPEQPNDVALRLIGSSTPTSILFCGRDQWAPEFHKEDLVRMQRHSEIPNNIHISYMQQLRHDFIVHPEMIDSVVEFCVDRIEGDGVTQGLHLRSRL